MFSSTMIASSTTIPTTRVRPSTVKVLRVNPKTYMTMKVPRIEVGMASSTFRVVDHEPRKSQADEAGEEGGQDQGEEDLVDGLLDEDGGVPVDAQAQPFGKLGLQQLHLGLHVAAHLHRVGARGAW